MHTPSAQLRIFLMGIFPSFGGPLVSRFSQFVLKQFMIHTSAASSSAISTILLMTTKRK